jgi:phosphoesterase RecJ-like protein
MISLEKKKEELNNLLKGKKRIVLTSHMNPDGDAVGSTLAMLHYFRKKGYEVNAMLPNEFPKFYSWMPGSQDIIIFEKDAKHCKELLKSADVIFSLDYNGFNRIGNASNFLREAQGKKIMIDHHPNPEDGFDYYLSTVNTSSTGELVFEFINLLGDGNLIDKDIAATLFVAIMTDTGSFSYSCNNSNTFKVVADLIEKGVDVSKIHKLVYDTYSENRLRLLGYSLKERMIVWPDLHSAVIYLSKADLKKFNYKVGDLDGVSNYPLSMENVNLSALITEKDKKIRISLRSKGNFSVDEIARKYYEGGGHINAAGGYSYDNIEKTIKRLKEILEAYKDKLNFKLDY